MLDFVCVINLHIIIIIIIYYYYVAVVNSSCHKSVDEHFTDVRNKDVKMFCLFNICQRISS